MVPTWALYQHRQNLRNTGPDGGGREGRKICPDHAWNGLQCMRALVEAFPDIWGLDDFNELTPLLLRRRAGHIGSPNVYVESQARASRAIQLNPRDAARTLYLERHPWVVKAPPPTAPPPQLPKPPPPIPEVEMLPSEPAGSSLDSVRGGDQDVHISGLSEDDQPDDASLAASLMQASRRVQNMADYQQRVDEGHAAEEAPEAESESEEAPEDIAAELVDLAGNPLPVLPDTEHDAERVTRIQETLKHLLPGNIGPTALEGAEPGASPEATMDAYVASVRSLAVRFEVLRESELRHGCTERLRYQNLLHNATTDATAGSGSGLSHRAVQEYIEEVDRATEDIQICSAVAAETARNILGPAPPGDPRLFGTSAVNEQRQAERMSDQARERLNQLRVASDGQGVVYGDEQCHRCGRTFDNTVHRQVCDACALPFHVICYRRHLEEGCAGTPQPWPAAKPKSNTIGTLRGKHRESTVVRNREQTDLYARVVKAKAEPSSSSATGTECESRWPKPPTVPPISMQTSPPILDSYDGTMPSLTTEDTY